MGRRKSQNECYCLKDRLRLMSVILKEKESTELYYGKLGLSYGELICILVSECDRRSRVMVVAKEVEESTLRWKEGGTPAAFRQRHDEAADWQIEHKHDTA